MSYRDEDDPFEEDIVFDQAGLLSTTRKSSKSAIRRVSSGKCAMFSKTLGLCGAFLGLGLTCAIPGPLSPLPPGELREDISLMSYEIMYRCQGFMIGAMFGARLLDRFNRLFLVFLALLVTALLVTIIPWCGIVWLLRTDMFLLGATLGFLSTGGNVLCLDLWGRNSGPFMQALHFSFSLGVFLAPFLSQPLMVPISYSPVTPSTTPAMFNLHRLPRDVGNMSSAAIVKESASLLQTTASTYHHDLLKNNSWTSLVASSSSSSSVVTPTVGVGHQVSSIPYSVQASNSSLQNFTSSPPLVKKTTVHSPTVSLPPSPQDLLSASVSVLSSHSSRQNISIASTTPVSVVLHPSTEASQVANGTKIDSASTTTHKTPRPKPVLTNSEKLKDKNWENDKFRKPPPEDLVPLFTTMKALVHPSNTTVTVVSVHPTPNSTQPSPLQGNNSTPLPSVTNSSKLAILSKIIDISNNSSLNSSLTSKPSSSFISNSSSLNSLLTSKPLSSLISNNSSLNSSLTSKPLSSLASIAATSSTANLNTTSVAVKVDSHSSSTNSPIWSSTSTLVHPKVEEATSAKPIFKSQTELNKTSNYSLSHDDKKSAQYVNKSGSAKLPIMKYSTSFEEVSQNHTSEEFTLPLLEDPNTYNDSHVAKDGNWHSGLSLDEQDATSLGLPRITPSVTEGLSRISQPESVNHFTSERLSTPRPLHHSVEHEPQSIEEELPVKVKATMKPVLEPLEYQRVLSAEQENLKSLSSLQKASTKVVNIAESSTVSSSISLPTKNSTQVFKSFSHVGLPVGPKHTHHSKPASTVVNYTEVTHTVIDAFANRLEKYGLSKMQLMYLTVGMVLLATSFLFLGFLCFNPRDPKAKTDDEDMNGSVVRSGSRSRINSGQSVTPPPRWLRHALIGLMLLILMITSGVQAMYGQLLLVYAMQSPLQLSQSTGTALTATFLGALTSTRFACILLGSALSPAAMLVLSVSICSCATWLLSALATSSEVALWIGSVMVGVGTASVFPSGLLWMQRHVLITHRVAAMLVMGPAMGEMFFPTLAYKMMVSMGPASLVHLPALLSLFAIALWAAEWRLARYPRQSLCSHADDSSGYQLASQHDEDDLLDLTMLPVINGNSTIARNGARPYASGHSVHRMSA